jgi:hypothetical protein
MTATAQIDAHGDRPDVQVLIGDHIDGFKDLVRMDKHGRVSLYPVHEAENIFMLNNYLHTQFCADRRHGFLKGGQIYVVGLDFGQHDHGEQIIHNGLPDIGNIDIVFGHDPTDSCHDTHPVQTDNRDYKTT